MSGRVGRKIDVVNDHEGGGALSGSGRRLIEFKLALYRVELC